MDTSVDDLFLEVEGGESGTLRFIWEADNKLAMVVAGDGDHRALQSSPSPNMMMHMSDNSDHDAKSIEELYNRMIIDLAGPSNATPATDNNRGPIRMEMERGKRPQDSIEMIQAEPSVRPEDSKKRELWTIDEQKSFLMGVMVFGYKWKQIRTHFVRSKSCSQFGSHVQKFKKRLEQMNRKKHTINDIRIEDITREDVVRLAPKEWQPTLLSAIASKTSEQQIPIASSHGNSTGPSSSTQLRLLVPSVHETVMNPSAPIVQPVFSVGLASSSVGPTPVQPGSFYLSFADGCCTPLVQPSRRPHLGEAYLGYPSSTYNPASYQPLSVPQLSPISAPGSYYSTPMQLPNSYPGLAPPPALHPSAGIRQGWDCPNPWKNS